MCLFYCVHYYVDVLPVHLSGISHDIKKRDDVDESFLFVFCAVISWMTLFLILLTSFVVAVPMSQLSASPNKGRRLLLVHLLEAGTPSKEGSFFRS